MTHDATLKAQSKNKKQSQNNNETKKRIINTNNKILATNKIHIQSHKDEHESSSTLSLPHKILL